ncbi:MAG: hypothetical protein WCK55_21365, partial [Verrucomicrobiota bacterium]
LWDCAAADKPAAQSQSEMQKWIDTIDAQWQAGFKRDVTDVLEAELKKAKLQYITALEDGIKKASSANDLKGALALRDDQKRFGGTQDFPQKDEDTDAPALKAVRALIRTQLKQMEFQNAVRTTAVHKKYDHVLAHAQAQLTKAQRLDDAQLVQIKRDLVKAVWLDVGLQWRKSARKEKLGLYTIDSRYAIDSEDPQVVQSLRFSHPYVAPLDTRRMTNIQNIQGHFVVENSGPKRRITDVLVAEMRMLCRNKDQAWAVIATSYPFNVEDIGEKLISIRFRTAENDLIAELNGNRNEKPYDTYTAIRYKGVLIYEVTSKNTQDIPKDWWKDDTIRYKK